MRFVPCILAALFLTLSGTARATLSVIDVNAIRVSLTNARRALAEQVLHGTRQLEQIQKAAHQIQLIDNYLERFGDPAKVSLATFNEAIGLLNELNLNKSSQEIVKDIQGEEVFRATEGSSHRPISPEILIDGEAAGTRDPEIYTPQVAVRRSLAHYREVRSSALLQRKRIRTEIETTLRQLRAAATASEVAKLDALLRVLESQLAANDREIEFASGEVLTRFLESEVEAQVRAKARMQHERASLRVSTERDLQVYRLPTKPLRFRR